MKPLYPSSLLALTLACLAGCAVQAETTDEGLGALASPPRILALGDSMAFGWDPFVQKDAKQVDPSDYRGYAEVIGDQLGSPVDNGSCPGEASGSFVDPRKEDNDCRKNRKSYPLHVNWSDYAGAAETQLEFVEGYLTAKKSTKLITLSIGGNDLLLLQKNCNLGPLTAPCELARLPFYLRDYGENLETFFTRIDAAGYHGTVAVLTTYALDYNDAIANLGLSTFNDKLREVARAQKLKHPNLHVVVADGFGAFKARAALTGGNTCQTGLLIPSGGGSCDIHPSKAGHELLATTIIEAIKDAGLPL